MMYPAAQAITDKCKEYGFPAPLNGEYWEDSLNKILALIEHIEGRSCKMCGHENTKGEVK